MQTSFYHVVMSNKGAIIKGNKNTQHKTWQASFICFQLLSKTGECVMLHIENASLSSSQPEPRSRWCHYMTTECVGISSSCGRFIINHTYLFSFYFQRTCHYEQLHRRICIEIRTHFCCCWIMFFEGKIYRKKQINLKQWSYQDYSVATVWRASCMSGASLLSGFLHIQTQTHLVCLNFTNMPFLIGTLWSGPANSDLNVT